MDDIFDRLGRTIRSIFADNRPSNDPDLADAWKELNDYLGDKDPFQSEEPGERQQQERQQRQQQRQQYSRQHQHSPQSDLGASSADWKNLELARGADAPAVRRAYKRLLSLYHPDRHSDDPEKQRLATEITSRLNQSYDRIMQELDK